MSFRTLLGSLEAAGEFDGPVQALPMDFIVDAGTFGRARTEGWKDEVLLLHLPQWQYAHYCKSPRVPCNL